MPSELKETVLLLTMKYKSVETRAALTTWGLEI